MNNDSKLEQQAREMLAAVTGLQHPDSLTLPEGTFLVSTSDAIRAIVAALSQRDALVAEYERACGIKGEGYVHALMHIFNAITNAHIDAKVAALSQQRAVACRWTYDLDGDAWDTGCGEKWQFTCDGPAENNFRFCHGCGHPVEVAAPSPEQPGNQCAHINTVLGSDGVRWCQHCREQLEEK